MAMSVAIRPASPNVLIKSDFGKTAGATKRKRGGVRVRQHAGRSDHEHGVAKRLVFSFALKQAGRGAGERQTACCPKKLITMISGVITLRENMLRRKSSQPRAAEGQQRSRSNGGACRR